MLNRAFIISFIGLKPGTHEYKFAIRKPFFEDIENALIEDAELEIVLLFEKKETMMVANFDLSGEVTAACDRCNDPVTVPIDGRYRIVYRFGLEHSEDENLVVLHPEAYEIDLSTQLYEFMVVSLPSRITHEAEEDCNQEVMQTYKQFVVNPGDEDDEDDWDEDDFDDEDEDWDDEDDNEDQNDEDSGDEPDNNRPIDPRWSALKNLN